MAYSQILKLHHYSRSEGHQNGHLMKMFLENEKPSTWNTHHLNENDGDLNQIKLCFIE